MPTLVWQSTELCGVSWCGVGWGGVRWGGVVWCGVVWRGMVWFLGMGTETQGQFFSWCTAPPSRAPMVAPNIVRS